MVLDVIVLLLIILVTLFLSTQGMLSSLLALATAIFSSILAMGLMEFAAPAIGSWRIDYARGVSFLAIFALAFGITRFAADYAVPKNIKVPLWINRIAGGVVGFFAALVIVGTTVIGIEMMPLPSAILGKNRFPAETVMKGEVPGIAGKPAGIWLSPDGFVLGIWNMASGRALGGNRPWGAVHPDITTESYGYRYIVERGSQRSVHESLFSTTDSWISADAKDVAPFGITLEQGKRILMVRTKIEKGDTPPRLSADVGGDAYFRASAAQIRLVTEERDRKGRFHQYFPIGYLEFGKKFVAMPLDSGHVVDDYVNNSIVSDWVFEIPADHEARTIEVKQFGRKELANFKDKPFPALAAAEYPQHAYLKDLGSFKVTISLTGKKFDSGMVYLLRSGVKHSDVTKEVYAAGNRAESIRSNIAASSGGWVLPMVGVPTKGEFQGIAQEGPMLTNAPDDQVLAWHSVLRVIILAQAVPNGESNLRDLPKFFESDVITMLRNGREGSAILDSAPIAADTLTAELGRVTPGNKTVLVVLKTRTSYVMWLLSHDFVAKDVQTRNLNGDNPSAGNPAPIVKIDLDERVPPP